MAFVARRTGRWFSSVAQHTHAGSSPDALGFFSGLLSGVLDIASLSESGNRYGIQVSDVGLAWHRPLQTMILEGTPSIGW